MRIKSLSIHKQLFATLNEICKSKLCKWIIVHERNYAYTVLFVFAVLLCLKQKTQDCHNCGGGSNLGTGRNAAKSDPPDRADSTAYNHGPTQSAHVQQILRPFQEGWDERGVHLKLRNKTHKRLQRRNTTSEYPPKSKT